MIGRQSFPLPKFDFTLDLVLETYFQCYVSVRVGLDYAGFW